MSNEASEQVRVVGSMSFLLNKLAQLAGKEMAAALAPLGLSPRESGVIAALAEFGPMSQQRIGELLLIDRTTMVLSIDRLEELEFVERTLDATDRRRFLVVLTVRGVEAVGDAQRRLEAFEDELLTPLSAGERTAFRAALLALVRRSLPADLLDAPLTKEPR
jgi:DNA-binding MarR family transcriptional regulator